MNKFKYNLTNRAISVESGISSQKPLTSLKNNFLKKFNKNKALQIK